MQALSRFRHVHLPARAGSAPTVEETPADTGRTDRMDCLIAHGFALPPAGTGGARAVSRFIDGEPLSHSDNLELSRWLSRAQPENPALWLAMQRLSPSFTPMLDLCPGNAPTDARIQALTEALLATHQCALENGLKFGVVVHEKLPPGLARLLHEAVLEAPSSVRALDYPCHTHTPACEETHALLQACLRDGSGLQSVGGSFKVLPLLERSVPELVLIDPAARPDLDALRRVLRIGGVHNLSFKNDLPAAHEAVCAVVAETNAALSARPQDCVHGIELKTFSPYITRHDEGHILRAVRSLFAARHLKAITLPDPSWLWMPLPELQALMERSPLQSLRFLSLGKIDRDDSAFERLNLLVAANLLDPVLEHNRVLERERAAKVSGAFTRVLSAQALQNSSKHDQAQAGLEINPLAEHLAQVFRGAREVQDMAQVHPFTGAAAALARDTASQQLERERALRPALEDIVLTPGGFADVRHWPAQLPRT